jgi:hypothetical protein
MCNWAVCVPETDGRLAARLGRACRTWLDAGRALLLAGRGFEVCVWEYAVAGVTRENRLLLARLPRLPRA